MSRPQQPELARSAKTDLDPDHVETGLQGQKRPSSGGETGPVPPENQPGHHPPKEQDKPDLDAFAARLGTDPKAPAATSARKAPRPKAGSTKTASTKTPSAKTAPAKTAPAKAASAKAAPAKTAPAKTAPAKAGTKRQPAKDASRPATTAQTAQKESPAAPPRVEATPAKRPAAAPTAQPHSAPSPRQAAQISIPQPEPDGEREPRIVGLMLLPLRQAVKGLSQLDRLATERLSRRLRAREGRGSKGR